MSDEIGDILVCQSSVETFEIDHLDMTGVHEDIAGPEITVSSYEIKTVRLLKA